MNSRETSHFDYAAGLAWDAGTAGFSKARAWYHRAKARKFRNKTPSLRGALVVYDGRKEVLRKQTTSRRRKGIRKMPRRRRTKRKRGRAGPYRKRRKSRARKRRRIPMSTRMLPASKKMSFEMIAQLEIDTLASGWGTIAIPVNCMERPFGNLLAVPATFGLTAHTYGTVNKQPEGYDRWLAASSTTEGKYYTYIVDSCTIQMQYVPGARTDTGINLIAGSRPYTEASSTEDLRGLDETRISDLLAKKKYFTGQKVFNEGDFGSMWRMTWNRKTHYKKFPGQKPDDPSDDLFHSNAAEGDVPNLHYARFMVGQLGEGGASTPTEWLAKITYNVTLTEPTQWEISLDAGGGVYS